VGDLTFCPPEAGEAEELEANLRPADRAEIIAASGPDTLGIIRGALAISQHAITVREAGELLCVFGVVEGDLLGRIAIPWMLGTPALDQRARTLIRVTRRYFDAMLDLYPLLVNYADARHVDSLRLVRAAGCTVHPAEPFGFEGRPFHKFTRERAYV